QVALRRSHYAGRITQVALARSNYARRWLTIWSRSSAKMHDPDNEDSRNFSVRRATVTDAGVIAHQRASMFQGMGTLPSERAPALCEMTIAYLKHALPSGEYLAWLAFDVSAPETIVAGAGLLLRQIQPFPIMQGPLTGRLASGKQGLVMNVFVEPAWRRRGLANMLMQQVMAVATSEGVESLVLNASKEGRMLYEQLGFIATNEMWLIPT
ncbi:MAG: GNAT family N-acetyltransferase, partial [Gemmatimonas sp.]